MCYFYVTSKVVNHPVAPYVEVTLLLSLIITPPPVLFHNPYPHLHLLHYLPLHPPHKCLPAPHPSVLPHPTISFFLTTPSHPPSLLHPTLLASLTTHHLPSFLTPRHPPYSPHPCALLCDPTPTFFLTSSFPLPFSPHSIHSYPPSTPSFHTLRSSSPYLPGPYLEKNDWGGEHGSRGRRPLRRGGCGRGMCPLSTKCEAETTSILQNEWEAKKRKEIHCSCRVALSMEKFFFLLLVGGGDRPPPPPPQIRPCLLLAHPTLICTLLFLNTPSFSSPHPPFPHHTLLFLTTPSFSSPHPPFPHHTLLSSPHPPFPPFLTPPTHLTLLPHLTALSSFPPPVALLSALPLCSLLFNPPQPTPCPWPPSSSPPPPSPPSSYRPILLQPFHWLLHPPHPPPTVPSSFSHTTGLPTLLLLSHPPSAIPLAAPPSPPSSYCPILLQPYHWLLHPPHPPPTVPSSFSHTTGCSTLPTLLLLSHPPYWLLHPPHPPPTVPSSFSHTTGCSTLPTQGGGGGG